jgi:hypothetical protein
MLRATCDALPLAGLDVSGRRYQVQGAGRTDTLHPAAGRCIAQGDIGYALLYGTIA